MQSPPSSGSPAQPTDAYEVAFGVPKPSCCSNGDCCKGASPSKPFYQLLANSATGDDFARGFFSIMIPYANHAAASAVVPGLVQRMLLAATKQPDTFKNPETDLVFYHCRYLQPDDKCGVYEDRPQFCRDYPDSPFMVFAPGCAFEEWGKTCQQQAKQLDVTLQSSQALLSQLKQSTHKAGSSPILLNQPDVLSPTEQQQLQLLDLSVLLALTPLWVGSPLGNLWW
jgi:Fe-S-cluster containining protein